jgi:hypothetical protein
VERRAALSLAALGLNKDPLAVEREDDLMPNVFPNILADTMKRRRKKFQNRTRAADGGLWVNVPHPIIEYFFHAEWGTLSAVDLDAITAHFDTNGANTFTLFDNPRPLGLTTPVSFGTGNGSTTTFTLPAKSVIGPTIRVSGSPTGAYSLSVGAGVDGEDVIIFSAAPANAAPLTFSATSARRRHKVWYTTEELEETPVEADIWALTLDFEESVP